MNKIKKLMSVKEIITIIIVTLIGSVSQPLLAYSYIILGDYINTNKNENITNVIIMMILSLLGIGIYYFISIYIKNNIGLKLRKMIFSDILKQDLKKTITKDSSEYFNLLNSKVDSWRDRYLTSILAIFKNILQIILMVSLLITINLKIALVVILFLFPLIINNIFFPKMINRKLSLYFDSNDYQLNELKDVFDGIIVIKNSKVENRTLLRINSIFDKTNNATQSLSFLENLSGFFANIGVAISQISGVILAMFFLNNGSLSLGQFMGVLQLTFFLNEPFIELINNFIQLTSMSNLNKDCFKNRSIISHTKNKPLKTVKTLELKNLNLTYNETKVFKENINFIFKDYKKYLVKGESGSGKSSLSKLILKILDHIDGDILINDISYTLFNSEEIHRMISYINQEPYVFNLSLKENIDLSGRLKEDEVIALIHKVRLNKLMEELGGVRGMIDKTSRQISGGEKARIAIARALADNKEIIVVDEILANLDSENSYNIEKLLLNLNEKILINICHHHNEELKSFYDGELRL